ncbi:hypothetical protein BH09MYX1_BH09MYX1_66300 [soil metagenome]
MEGGTEANETARDVGEAARGLVRSTAPVDLCEAMLAETLVRFVAAYPEIRVDVVATSRYVDLVAEGVDIAVRFGVLADSSLVARKLPMGRSVLLASKSYLSQHGTPKRVADLSAHDFVLFRAPSGAMRIELDGPNGREAVDVKGRLGSDDLSFVRRATIEGAGIAFLPTFLSFDALHSSALVPVLPKYEGIAGTGHIVFPTSRFLPKRVSLLADFIAEDFARAVGSAEATCKKRGAAKAPA